ncbi:MAG: hypothetical protein ACI97A_000173 [Planctomycetota bacterium]|jgi:hypothetical protein
MTKKQNGFGASMGPDDGESIKDSAEDQALWQLMGVLDDVKPSSDFIRSLTEQTTRPIALRPWYRRGWVPAAAAVLMIAITIPFALESKSGSTKNPDKAQNVAEYQGVVELLGGLSDADVLDLDANETESVQADWFGG